MFDNILSVKAPFIMDLFSFVQTDVEKYSSQLFYIPENGIDESIIVELNNKYFERMTYDSIKKSYKTFIRLLLISDNEDCKNNLYGLYTFTYALTAYLRTCEGSCCETNRGVSDQSALCRASGYAWR